MTNGPTDQAGLLEPTEHRELVRGFAENLVGQVEPDELAVFDETAEEYFADPRAVLHPRRRDEAVGFGIDAELLTPIVLAIAGPVVEYLTAIVVEATGEGIKPTLVRMVRRLLRLEDAGAAGPEPPALTQEQIDSVRSIAFARACDIGLTEGRARLLADAVAGGVRTGS